MFFRKLVFFLVLYLGLIFSTMVLVLDIPSTVSLAHKLPNAALIWMNNISLVSSVSFALLVGALVERFNNKHLLILIFGINLISLILYSHVNNGVVIIVSRAFQAIIFGIYPILYKSLYSIFSVKKKRERTGIILSTLTANISSPIAIYGFFTIGFLEKDKLYNFHALYTSLIGISAFFLLLSIISKAPNTISSKAKFSYYAIFIYAIALISLAYGINDINIQSIRSKYIALYIILGIVSFAVAFFIEKYSEIPSTLAKIVDAKKLFLSNALVICIGVFMQIYTVAINFAFLYHGKDRFHYMSNKIQIPVLITIGFLYLYSFIAPNIYYFFYKKGEKTTTFLASINKRYISSSIIFLVLSILTIYFDQYVRISNIAVRVLNVLVIAAAIYYMQSLIGLSIIGENKKNGNIGTYIGLLVSSQGIGNIIGFVLCITPFLDRYVQSLIVSTTGMNILVKNYSYFNERYYNTIMFVMAVIYIILAIMYMRYSSSQRKSDELGSDRQMEEKHI